MESCINLGRSVLVTGASGFLGSFVAKALVKSGYQVDAFVRNLEKAQKALPQEVTLLQGDLSDRKRLQSVFEDKEYSAILHIGAIRNAWGIPSYQVLDVNYKTTKWILEYGVKENTHFIYCSSALVNDIFRPTLYTKCKVYSENIINEWVKTKKIKATIIRPSVLYGAGDPRGTVCNLASVLLSGLYRTVGSGTNRIVLTDVNDVTEAFLKTLDCPETYGKTLTIADTPGVEVNEYVETVAGILGVKVSKLKIPSQVALMAGWVLEKGGAVLGLKNDPVINVHKVDVMIVDHHFDTKDTEEILKFKPSRSFPHVVRENLEYFWSINTKFQRTS